MHIWSMFTTVLLLEPVIKHGAKKWGDIEKRRRCTGTYLYVSVNFEPCQHTLLTLEKRRKNSMHTHTHTQFFRGGGSGGREEQGDAQDEK